MNNTCDTSWGIHSWDAGPIQLLYFEDSRACPACHYSRPHNTFPCPPPTLVHSHQSLTILLHLPGGVFHQGSRHGSLGRTDWSGRGGSDLGQQAPSWRILLPLEMPSNYQGCRPLALQGPRGTSGNLPQEDAPIPSGSFFSTGSKWPACASRSRASSTPWLCSTKLVQHLLCADFSSTQVPTSHLLMKKKNSRCLGSNQTHHSFAGLFCPPWHRPHSWEARTNLSVSFSIIQCKQVMKDWPSRFSWFSHNLLF